MVSGRVTSEYVFMHAERESKSLQGQKNEEGRWVTDWDSISALLDQVLSRVLVKVFIPTEHSAKDTDSPLYSLGVIIPSGKNY